MADVIKTATRDAYGKALAELEVTQDKLVPQIMTVKGKVNLGFLGFKDGENKYTYPKFEEGKVHAMFSLLDSLCDYVIVDCTSNLGNPIARVAVKCADQVIRLAAPELSSISYFSSQLPLYGDPAKRLYWPKGDLWHCPTAQRFHLRGQVLRTEYPRR